MKTNLKKKTETNDSYGSKLPISNRVSTIENIVMARVRRIHFLRQFVHPTLLKIYSGGVLFGALASMVSLANILANIPSLTAPTQVAQFAITAVMHTETFVQLVCLGLVYVCGLLVRDILQNSKQKISFVHA